MSEQRSGQSDASPKENLAPIDRQGVRSRLGYVTSGTGGRLPVEYPVPILEFYQPEFGNIYRLAEEIERLSGQPCYLEWTPSGVVSRYADGLHARVDLEQPDYVNRKAYLSVEQLECLAILPEKQIRLDYDRNLTEHHFKLIKAYGKTCRRQKPAKQNQTPAVAPRLPKNMETRRLNSSSTKTKKLMATFVLAAAITMPGRFDRRRKSSYRRRIGFPIIGR